MIPPDLDLSVLPMVLAGALAGGFVTGFAGFGTSLVAAGFWFHVLPPAMVPPMIALAAVAAQLVGQAVLRKTFDTRRVLPYLAGALIGIPVGILALKFASPALLRIVVGAFLIFYTLFQLGMAVRVRIGDWGGRGADGAIGAVGGFLGGFAGLSGPVPLIWLQLRGGPSAGQRAVYQPFNLIVLSITCAGMALAGLIDLRILTLAALCMPVTVAGAWAGVRLYGVVDDRIFRRAVLVMLFVSGAFLVGQTMFG
jgi:uncharacterized membrane protein YfcA